MTYRPTFLTLLLIAACSLTLSMVHPSHAQSTFTQTQEKQKQTQDFWVTPVIQHYGKIHLLDKTAYRPDPKETYKIVFMLTHAAKDAQTVNSGLDHVARTVNLYRAAGVPPEHLKIVAVISAKATPAVLDNAFYRAINHVDNPNLPLIAALRKAGIDVTVCGQAIPENNFTYEQVNKNITLSFSALLTVSILEHQGYVLIPF